MGVAIVTGASSGIGLEMARELDADGHQVFIVARSQALLDQLARSLNSAHVIVADLSRPEGIRDVRNAVAHADILVNNAGFGHVGPFADCDAQVVRDMLHVNCIALTELTRQYLPGMLERGSGRILNIASAAAFQPGPNMAQYFATKAYVLSFSEAVHEEIRQSGVTVTAFCPGAFASGFQGVAGADHIRLNKGRTLPSSSALAKEALAAMYRGDAVSIPGFSNKIGAYSTRFVPRRAVRTVVKWMNSAP